MNIILGIFVGLLVLMTLIVAHEFGHFIAARRSGVRVKEFGIGFPPRACAWLIKTDKSGKKKWEKLPKSEWKKEQDSLIFSINFLPIGGFCAMDGESDADTKKGTFGSVSYLKKTIILFGGVLMNWLVAFIILTVLCWTGLPPLLTNQFSIKSDETIKILESVEVTSVLEGSPAEKAGFKEGDKIVSVEDSSGPLSVYLSQDIVDFNAKNAGQEVVYRITRDCRNEEDAEVLTSTDACGGLTSEGQQSPLETKTLKATLNPSDSDYLLGITMSLGNTESHYTWSAPIVAAGLTVQITGETFKGLWNLVVSLITGAVRQVSTDSSIREQGREQISEATEGVSGIVGIIGGYFPALIESGPTLIFLFMAVISISLACMNVLPIPALDGGRWLMITIARLKHKKLSQETEQRIVAKAFIALLILMAIITIMDIIRLF